MAMSAIPNLRKKKVVKLWRFREYHSWAEPSIAPLHHPVQLSADITSVISNHDDLRSMSSGHGIPFHSCSGYSAEFKVPPFNQSGRQLD